MLLEFRLCYFSDRSSDVANCDQTESEYLLRNTFSQINEKKLTKSNESKMEAIPLSKRSPCVQKLLCNRLKKNFYEEKTFPNLLKKF